jgi:alpha-galactosidase
MPNSRTENFQRLARPRSIRRAIAFSMVLVLALCSVKGAPDPADVTGTWRTAAPKPFGVTIYTYLTLRGQGAQLEGTLLVNGGIPVAIHDARVDGGDVVFGIDWGWKFRVRRDGENLRVVITEGGKTREAVWSPVPDAEGTAPPEIPPPALRSLPSNGLARTPPMGWNSWNHFQEAVDDKVVRETADAMVTSGMAAAGYLYVNIDDTWEGGRDAMGNIVANRKFPDMKALADYIHAKGLKFGIYSSPGPATCAGYMGTYGHEEQDARTFAAWGVDYLKYDWCSAESIYSDADLRPVYQRMGEALLKCGRPIVFSLCEYGRKDVWAWGPEVAGNLWRTTGDIRDSWKSMSGIGFDQGRLAPYAAPGHWNDPDMLEVGNGGMSATEYRTHLSLWSMLAAPLIAGNDLRSMSDETREILTNREVLAIDQDGLGIEATRAFARNGVEVWTRPLVGGGQAVGVFNRGDADAVAAFTWAQIGRQSAPANIRDLWAHRSIAPAAAGFDGTVAAHGVILMRMD